MQIFNKNRIETILQIGNSMNPTQYIYILRNPNNQEIFYVGMTVNPKNRYSCHCYGRRMKGAVGPKDYYLATNNIKPIMEIVQTVNDGRGLIRERRWIKRLRKQGHPLTNYLMWDER